MPTTAHATARTFEEYAAAAWPSLYRRAYLLSGNQADAEDLAQHTLIKVHGAWSRVSRADAPDAYVRRILTNSFLSMKRPRGRRLELPTGDNAPELVSPPIDGPEDRLVLWPHVRALPPRQRAVIVLRYYEKLSGPRSPMPSGARCAACRRVRQRHPPLAHPGDEQPCVDSPARRGTSPRA